ncbi:MAG: hypothetical protein HKL99_00665 [Burkholderiales bacterium]|nr:hypothetical protein [Burkholderiales bacterium]
MRHRLLKLELVAAVAGFLIAGELAGPVWALAGALGGLLAWMALKRAAPTLIRGSVVFAAAFAIAADKAVGPRWAWAGAVLGALFWLGLADLRERLRKS